MRINLAHNWKRLHKSTTVVLGLVLTVLQTLNLASPAFVRWFGQDKVDTLSVTLPILIVVLRYWQQGSVSDPNNPPTC